jgi:hypothetical protein
MSANLLQRCAAVWASLDFPTLALEHFLRHPRNYVVIFNMQDSDSATSIANIVWPTRRQWLSIDISVVCDEYGVFSFSHN